MLKVSVQQFTPPDEATLAKKALAEAVGRAATADVIVLPEAATCGGLGPQGQPLHAEPLDGPFTASLQSLSLESGGVIIAGMFEMVPGSDSRPYNTTVVMGPHGIVAAYRKIHLFDAYGSSESRFVRPGPPVPTTFDIEGYKVGLMTCYDLRFPELARALVDDDCDVLIVTAAWVAGVNKAMHWETLVGARAIENCVYVVACGQPGPKFSGLSRAVDPQGLVLATASPSGPDGFSVTLNRSTVASARATNPCLDNRRLAWPNISSSR